MLEKIRKNLSENMNLFAILLIIYVVVFMLLLVLIKTSFFDIYDVKESETHKLEIENLYIGYDNNRIQFPYGNIDDVKSYDKGTTATITGTLPKTRNSYNNPAIYFETRNNFYNVYINNKQVYGYESSVKPLTGTTWSVIPIENNFSGDKIRIEMLGNTVEEAGRINNIYVDESAAIYIRIFFSSAVLTMLCLILFLLGLLLCITYISAKYRNRGMYYIGIISILYATFFFGTLNNYFGILSDNPFIWFIMSVLTGALIPLFFIKYFTYYVDDYRIRNIINKILDIYLCSLMALSILNYGEIVNVYYSIPYLYIIPLIVGAYLIVYLIKKYYNKIINKKNVFLDLLILIPMFTLVIGMLYDTALIFSSNYKINAKYISLDIAIFFIIFCGLILTKVLKDENSRVVKLTEENIINKEIIKLMINDQNKLYGELNYYSLLSRFRKNNLTFLYPYISEEELLQKSVERSYYLQGFRKFSKFKNNVSYFIYVEVRENNKKQYKIAEASGEFYKYRDKNPYEFSEFKEFKDIISRVNFNNNFHDDELIIPIGSEEKLNGVIYFDNIHFLTDTQKLVLESYLKTTSKLIENKIIMQNAKSGREDVVLNLALLSEYKTTETSLHIRRVSMYSKLIGKKLGLKEEEIENLYLASMIHDIGKVYVPDSIIGRLGELNEDEMEIKNSHVDFGYEILENCSNRILKSAALIARQHHDNFDGTGRHGLRGEEIYLYARIVAVADKFDRLAIGDFATKPLTVAQILDYFECEKGKSFDPGVIDILKKNIRTFVEIKEKYNDF